MVVDGNAASSKTAEPKGKSTAFTNKIVPPSGPRNSLKGNVSRSHSRGRSKLGAVPLGMLTLLVIQAVLILGLILMAKL